MLSPLEQSPLDAMRVTAWKRVSHLASYVNEATDLAEYDRSVRLLMKTIKEHERRIDDYVDSLY